LANFVLETNFLETPTMLMPCNKPRELKHILGLLVKFILGQ
jgi:hypothetical protein